MANVDLEGLARARAKEHDNQHEGRSMAGMGNRGEGRHMGTRGTGRIHGNGVSGGGINRSTKPTPQADN